MYQKDHWGVYSQQDVRGFQQTLEVWGLTRWRRCGTIPNVPFLPGRADTLAKGMASAGTESEMGTGV